MDKYQQGSFIKHHMLPSIILRHGWSIEHAELRHYFQCLMMYYTIDYDIESFTRKIICIAFLLYLTIDVQVCLIFPTWI